MQTMETGLKPSPTLSIGRTAPDFTLADLSGQPHSLHEFRGRVVIINFWSAECTFAERVDRQLIPLLPTWGEAVALMHIASNANEPPDLLRRVSMERDLSLVLHDSDREVADRYGVIVTPHIFIADPQGVLRYQGAYNDITFRQRVATQDYVRQAVDALLEGSQPQVTQTAPYGCALVRFRP